MPRDVRNFWIEADIEGRKSTFASGPQAKDGGFTLRIFQRDKGEVVRSLRIEGIAHSDGRLEVAAIWPEWLDTAIKTEIIETTR